MTFALLLQRLRGVQLAFIAVVLTGCQAASPAAPVEQHDSLLPLEAERYRDDLLRLSRAGKINVTDLTSRGISDRRAFDLSLTLLSDDTFAADSVLISSKEELVRVGGHLTVGDVSFHIALALIGRLGVPLDLAPDRREPVLRVARTLIRDSKGTTKVAAIQDAIRGSATEFSAAWLALIGDPQELERSDLIGPHLYSDGGLLRHQEVNWGGILVHEGAPAEALVLTPRDETQ